MQLHLSQGIWILSSWLGVEWCEMQMCKNSYHRLEETLLKIATWRWLTTIAQSIERKTKKITAKGHLKVPAWKKRLAWGKHTRNSRRNSQLVKNALTLKLTFIVKFRSWFNYVLFSSHYYSLPFRKKGKERKRKTNQNYIICTVLWTFLVAFIL